jgi:hypothetical protein
VKCAPLRLTLALLSPNKLEDKNQFVSSIFIDWSNITGKAGAYLTAAH